MKTIFNKNQIIKFSKEIFFVFLVPLLCIGILREPVTKREWIGIIIIASILAIIFWNLRNLRKLREWVDALLVAAFLALCIVRPFFIQAFKIPTGSMRPTLLERDKILVAKFIYGAKIPFTDLRLPGISPPKRGDVIVFKSPEDPKKDFIKRLVATEGERVLISKGKIYINGKPLDEPPFSQRYYYNRGDYGQEDQEIIVPKDSLYVLGDNSASSRDSRYWGFVPEKNLVGKAFLIYWPPNRIRIIE